MSRLLEGKGEGGGPPSLCGVEIPQERPHAVCSFGGCGHADVVAVGGAPRPRAKGGYYACGRVAAPAARAFLRSLAVLVADARLRPTLQQHLYSISASVFVLLY